ncbi:hypothetical protein F5Y14DRAFT_447214 [Nemania sp. NC0429]|nr:hypothetical protein F5Y14DRAFT_447214 [Nemania sp. NC0429]
MPGRIGRGRDNGTTIFKSEGPVAALLVIILKELSRPYELQSPPACQLLLWDAHAIVSYLVVTYDDYLKISFREDQDWHFLTDQWHSFHARLMTTVAVCARLGWPADSYIAHYFGLELEKALETVELQLSSNLSGVRLPDGEIRLVTGGPWLVGNKMSMAEASLNWNAQMAGRYQLSRCYGAEIVTLQRAPRWLPVAYDRN